MTRANGRLFELAFPVDASTAPDGVGPRLFHDLFVWHRPDSDSQRDSAVDFLDQASESERLALRALQERAYAKAVEDITRQPERWQELARAYLAPVRGMIDAGSRIDGYHLLVCSDADDARAWGEWFGSVLPDWLTRFEERHGAQRSATHHAA